MAAATHVYVLSTAVLLAGVKFRARTGRSSLERELDREVCFAPSQQRVEASRRGKISRDPEETCTYVERTVRTPTQQNFGADRGSRGDLETA